jgi:hypothetical protein
MVNFIELPSPFPLWDALMFLSALNAAIGLHPHLVVGELKWKGDAVPKTGDQMTILNGFGNGWGLAMKRTRNPGCCWPDTK